MMTAGGGRGRWTSDEVSARLDDLFAQNDTTAGGFVEAAAVLASFDLPTVRPIDAASDSDEERHALALCATETRNAAGDPCWTLQTPVRREALKRLLAEGRIEQALAANPDREIVPAQAVLERWLRGQGEDLSGHQSLVDLHALRVVSEWLGGLVPNLPSLEQIHDQIAWETLLAPFHDLVADHFAGRVQELRALANYVEVLEAGTAVEKVRRSLRSVFSLVDQPPLFVFGPGGIGKSTLIAKFVLDHVHQPHVARFPFAYLDFDRPQLVAEEPITLLIEAVAQLGMQYPQAREAITGLQREWNRQMARESWAGVRLSAPTSGADGPPTPQTLPTPRPTGAAAVRAAHNHGIWTSRTLSNRDYYIETFAALVRDLRVDDQPLLLVLDTFEEVQLRSTSLVSNVFQFLQSLQARVPFLRTVLSGRVAVAPIGFKVRELALETFDLAAATAYLVSRTGVDAKAAEAVARQVTGSPLTLKLAADLLRKREATSADGFQTISTGFLNEFWSGSVTAQLYTRVLKHIADDDVRKLAHPGLVLRRITQGLIRDVMAGPCGIEVPDDAAASRLFNKLRLEVVLVSERTPGVLVHRPDLRSVMLQALQRAEPARVKDIHASAVTYYETHGTTAEERAEEIYHRLSLGLDRAAVERRWMEGVDRYLTAGVQELPPQAQAFLAARLNLTLPPEIWQQAEVIDWERWALREAREYMKADRIDDTLVLLDSRSDWTSAELRALRIDALGRSGRLQEAAAEAAETSAGASAGSTEKAVTDYYARLGREAQAPTAPAAAAESPQLVAALRDAFGSHEELRSLIGRFGLPDVQHLLPATEDAPADVAESLTAVALTSLATSGGWLPQLLRAARCANPGNLPLWSFAVNEGLAARGYPTAGDFEAVAAYRHRFSPTEVRRRLTVREGQMCRVLLDGKGHSTGWLIGPDLVLTSASIFGTTDPAALAQSISTRVSVLFDEWETDSSLRMVGSRCELAPDGIVAYRVRSANEPAEGIAYAVLRTASPIGQSSGAAGGRRGWVALGPSSGPPDFRIPTEQSFAGMWRYDSGGRLIFSFNVAGVRGPRGPFLEYEIEADADTSGALVVDETLFPIALHTGGAGFWMKALTRTHRQSGIPIGAIALDLYEKGIPLIPQDEPM